MVVWSAALAVAILRTCPNLLLERLGPRIGVELWDVAIMSTPGLIQLARYIVAGLDYRSGWTGGFPVMAQIAGLVVCGLSYALFVWATASNALFLRVCGFNPKEDTGLPAEGRTGLYAIPGTQGIHMLYEFAAAALLASWWALALGGLSANPLILRTDLEARSLQRELTGYVDYAHRVRYRLLPFV